MRIEFSWCRWEIVAYYIRFYKILLTASSVWHFLLTCFCFEVIALLWPGNPPPSSHFSTWIPRNPNKATQQPTQTAMNNLIKQSHEPLLPLERPSLETSSPRTSTSEIDLNPASTPNEKTWKRLKPARWITAKRLFILSLLINSILAIVAVHVWMQGQRICWDAFSKYSLFLSFFPLCDIRFLFVSLNWWWEIAAPLADDIDLRYHPTIFAGKPDAPTPWRYDGELPVPKSVDDAWASITSDSEFPSPIPYATRDRLKTCKSDLQNKSFPSPPQKTTSEKAVSPWNRQKSYQNKAEVITLWSK